METRTKILFTIFILAGVGVWAFLMTGSEQAQESGNKSASTTQTTNVQPTSSTSESGLSTYTNESIGLSFSYPNNWSVVDDEVVGESEYWVHLQRDGAELAFNVDTNYPYQEGGFVLSDDQQAEYAKITTENGTRIWRPRNKNVASTTQLQTLERQPVAEAASNGGRTAFNYIFPELNQTNNVGDRFDGGAGILKYGSSTLVITGAIENSSQEASSTLSEMDKIVSTAVFEEVATSSVANIDSNPVVNWKTYTDGEYGFSIQYPSAYDDLSQTTSDGSLKELYTDSSEAVLTDGGYNKYPQLNIRIFELTGYEYDTGYGTSYRYDAEANDCIVDGEQEVTNEPFDIQTANWGGCGIGTGDAGYSSSGYFIPHEEENVVLQITQGSYFGTRRPLHFDALVKTLEFSS